MIRGTILFCTALLPSLVAAFSATPATTAGTASKSNSMFETLKWGGDQPKFDVLQKTKDYVATFESDVGPSEEYYDDQYVLRGAVIGPMTRKDLKETQGGFDLKTAFSDIEQQNWGFAIDPENPFRCFWFQRWRATHTGVLKAGPQEIQPTMNRMDGPVCVNSVVWTPEQRIIYEQVGSTVDRFEGNTKGKAAVFGLLHTAGVEIPGTPGDWKLRLQQRLGHLLNFGRSWSQEEDIPAWWTSKARGGDPTD